MAIFRMGLLGAGRMGRVRWVGGAVAEGASDAAERASRIFQNEGEER